METETDRFAEAGVEPAFIAVDAEENLGPDWESCTAPGERFYVMDAECTRVCVCPSMVLAQLVADALNAFDEES